MIPAIVPQKIAKNEHPRIKTGAISYVKYVSEAERTSTQSVRIVPVAEVHFKAAIADAVMIYWVWFLIFNNDYVSILLQLNTN